jgi:hypothetical protein
MLAARILMMSLVARYVVLRGWWRRLVQVRTRLRLSAEARNKSGSWAGKLSDQVDSSDTRDDRQTTSLYTRERVTESDLG